MPRRERFVSDERTRLFNWRTAIADTNLPPTTKLMAFMLSMHMNAVGESCFPGLALMQRQTSLSRSTVQDHVRMLAECGWLERRQRPGRGHGTEYVATFPPAVVQEIIEKARSAGLSEELIEKARPAGLCEETIERARHPGLLEKGPENARERPDKGPPSRTRLSIEDERTRGREDEQHSDTNVSEAAPRVNKGRDVKSPDDLTDGQLMGLVRTHLYVPDGKPPAGEDGARDVTVIRALRSRRYSGHDIAAAIEGFALLRDRGEAGIPAGQKVTMRALYNTRTGVRPTFDKARDAYYKHDARRRRGEKAGSGISSIGDVLRGISGTSVAQR